VVLHLKLFVVFETSLLKGCAWCVNPFDPGCNMTFCSEKRDFATVHSSGMRACKFFAEIPAALK